MAEQTYTYEGAGTSDKDTMRFNIQDIGTDNRWQFSDQDLEWVIAEKGLGQGAIDAIQLLLIRYAKLKDEKTDKVDVKWSQLYDHYKDLLDTLQSQRSRVAIPWAGGISKKDKCHAKRDPDAIQSWANINDEDPEIRRTTYGGSSDEDCSCDW